MNKLELANKVLERCRLDTIKDFDDSILTQFPYNNLICFIDEGIASFSGEQVWSWGNEITTLTFINGTSIYNLNDYEIDSNNIGSVFIPDEFSPDDETKNAILPLVNTTDWKINYASSVDIGKPRCWNKEGSFLQLYPIPDKDYSISVDNFKQIPFLIGANDQILVIPKQHQTPIVDYICSCMTMIIEKKATTSFDDNYMRGLSRVSQANQLNDGVFQLPNNIDFGGIGEY